jgi:hypothetical protein
MTTTTKLENIELLKKEYRKECLDKKECLTYRGLLEWLKERGLDICYFDGIIEHDLLEFNNKIFNEIK